MKKIILSSALISIGVNVLLCLINLLCANMFHFMPFARNLAGGDCVEHIGFGIYVLETFPLTTSGEATSTYSISFNIASILIPILVLFIVLVLIRVLINKFKKA